MDNDQSRPSLVPESWNEQFIRQQLDTLHNRPPALSHFVDQVIERFVIRQDHRTAQARTHFLRGQIEQLKLAKDFQTSVDELAFHNLQKEIRQRELELQRKDLENRQQRQQELTDLKHQEEKLTIQLNMARLTRQISEETNPPAPSPPSPTPEQERERRRNEINERMTRRKSDEDSRLADITRGRAFEDLSDREQSEHKAVENMYQDLYEQDMDELRKYL